MKNTLFKLASVVLAGSLVLAACAPAATPTPQPTTPKLKIGLVTDTGGVNDKSFNQSAWEGVQRAADKFGL